MKSRLRESINYALSSGDTQVAKLQFIYSNYLLAIENEGKYLKSIEAKKLFNEIYKPIREGKGRMEKGLILDVSPVKAKKTIQAIFSLYVQIVEFEDEDLY